MIPVRFYPRGSIPPSAMLSPRWGVAEILHLTDVNDLERRLQYARFTRWLAQTWEGACSHPEERQATCNEAVQFYRAFIQHPDIASVNPNLCPNPPVLPTSRRVPVYLRLYPAFVQKTCAQLRDTLTQSQQSALSDQENDHLVFWSQIWQVLGKKRKTEADWQQLGQWMRIPLYHLYALDAYQFVQKGPAGN